MGFSLITIFEIGSYILQIFCSKVSQKSELLCSKCCKRERHPSKVICSGVLSTGRVQLDLLSWSVRQTKALYMSFDKFLLAVESRDLSQADKSIIRVSFFFCLSSTEA